jgi:hypothetical protein
MNNDRPVLTRREFLARSTALVASGAALYAAPGPALCSSNPCAPVVSFHVDRPYLDITGMAKPYLPPDGTRSGEPLAASSHEELLRRYGYL